MTGQGRASELFKSFKTGGEATINRFIHQEISEELYIDYKRSANNGNDSKLHQSDRENLARAVCGFGNSDGGIIVWGVDCRNDPARGDVPTSKHPIINVNRFLSYLEGTTSGATAPPHDGVRHHVIEQAGTSDGFVVTYIPKSLFAPHQCVVGKYKDRIYVRVGSNFENASYALLAGMFGKQPTPNNFHMWRAEGRLSSSHQDRFLVFPPSGPPSTPYVHLDFVIRNHGIAFARDIYLNYRLVLPGPNCGHQALLPAAWATSESLDGWCHVIAPEIFRLPPAAMVTAVTFEVYLAPPFAQELAYELSFGCVGSPVHRILGEVSPETIDEAYREFLASDQNVKPGQDFAKRVFDLERDQDYFRDVSY